MLERGGKLLHRARKTLQRRSLSCTMPANSLNRSAA